MHCTEKKNQQWEHAHNRPTMSWLFQLFGCLRATEFIYASCNFLLMRHLTFWIAAQPKQTGMKRKAKRIKKEANWEKSKYICSSGARIILWNGSECIVQRRLHSNISQGESKSLGFSQSFCHKSGAVPIYIFQLHSVRMAFTATTCTQSHRCSLQLNVTNICTYVYMSVA